MDDIKILYTEAVDLLKQLIAIPSFSREEERTAACIAQFLNKKEISKLAHLSIKFRQFLKQHYAHWKKVLPERSSFLDSKRYFQTLNRCGYSHISL